MTYKTHTTFALVITLPIQQYLIPLNTVEQVFFYLMVIFASLVPDLDEENSYLGKRLPIFPFILKLFGVEHRGVTHTLISVFVISVLFYTYDLFYYVSNFAYDLFLAFVIGYVAHLLGDMLTKGGINNFFYPLCKCKGVLLPRFLRFYTGSNQEIIVYAFLMLILFAEFVFIKVM